MTRVNKELSKLIALAIQKPVFTTELYTIDARPAPKLILANPDFDWSPALVFTGPRS